MAGAAPDTRISAQAGRAYWQGVDADISGMLGGLPAVSRIDLQGSRAFLARLGIGRRLRRVGRVLEGGAGIGRVTEGLLLAVAETVDVVEPIAKFTDALRRRPGVGRVFTMGLEEWDPAAGGGGDHDDGRDDGRDDGAGGPLYDLVWNQWCVGHLRDDDLVRYLQRCTTRLRDADSLIVVKENVATGGRDVFDDVDSSVTRQDDSFRRLFARAGLALVRSELQRALPRELYPVRMYALRPPRR